MPYGFTSVTAMPMVCTRGPICANSAKSSRPLKRPYSQAQSSLYGSSTEAGAFEDGQLSADLKFRQGAGSGLDRGPI